MTMKAIPAAALLAALPAQALAAKPCLSPAEAQGLVTFALPGAVEALGARCRPLLPPASLLGGRSAELAARYRAASEAAWPVARAGFTKMTDPLLMGILGDKAAKEMIANAVSSGLAGELKARDCATVDRVLTAIEPLPPRNVADLVAVVMELGAREAAKEEETPFTICPPPPPLTPPGERR